MKNIPIFDNWMVFCKNGPFSDWFMEVGNWMTLEIIDFPRSCLDLIPDQMPEKQIMEEICILAVLQRPQFMVSWHCCLQPFRRLHAMVGWVWGSQFAHFTTARKPRMPACVGVPLHSPLSNASQASQSSVVITQHWDTLCTQFPKKIIILQSHLTQHH